MKVQKLVAMLLIVAMAVSLSVTVSAEENSGNTIDIPLLDIWNIRVRLHNVSVKTNEIIESLGGNSRYIFPRSAKGKVIDSTEEWVDFADSVRQYQNSNIDRFEYLPIFDNFFEENVVVVSYIYTGAISYRKAELYRSSDGDYILNFYIEGLPWTVTYEELIFVPLNREVYSGGEITVSYPPHWINTPTTTAPDYTTTTTDTTPTTTTTPEEQYTYTINDALNILKHLAKLDTLTDEQEKLYDFFGYGEITTANALQILLYLAKLPSYLNPVYTPVEIPVYTPVEIPFRIIGENRIDTNQLIEPIDKDTARLLKSLDELNDFLNEHHYFSHICEENRTVFNEITDDDYFLEKSVIAVVHRIASNANHVEIEELSKINGYMRLLAHYYVNERPAHSMSYPVYIFMEADNSYLTDINNRRVSIYGLRTLLS
jgi:hypothetical protein